MRLDQLYADFGAYVASAYANSIADLVVFLAGLAVLFFGRHIWLNRVIRRARDSVPVVIGGWGTRGKSGTERMKAALVNALGYGVVSKTTGCEAMFLHARAYGRLREMFLFRPYDKATIWEQASVLRMAQRLKSEVFLWECMGLNPENVDVLQRQWMRDDLATVTNAYPDHEDIQGPSGYDVAWVICGFLPAGSAALTSEEQMLPLLRREALRQGTELQAVGWLEAGLVPPELSRRFSYEEHPYNIALVLALAQNLDIAPDYAIKEIADRVVPDLGVLKSFPVAQVDGRRLEFVNGMSANERLGTLTNWARMGFRRGDPGLASDTFITVLVNNRADRVARSRVFARMLVNDLEADLFVLIGSNLGGMAAFIAEEWQLAMAQVSLWSRPDPARPADPKAVIAQWARRLRVPANEAENTELRDFTATHAGATSSAAGDAAFHALLWTWFERRLLVIDDVHASGDDIVRAICARTPTGRLNRIMGVQNIKGTGMNWVNAWHEWERCAQACARARSPELGPATQGLRELGAFAEYNLLCVEAVHATLDAVRPTMIAQREALQVELARIEVKLSGGEVRPSGQARLGRFAETLLGWIESFLDAGDAVRRRKQADRIYADLVDFRVSHERAAELLQALTNRQKGGWLVQQVREWLEPDRGSGDDANPA